MRLLFAIAAILVTMLPTLARDYCANLGVALDILQIQVGTPTSDTTLTHTLQFTLDSGRNDHAMFDLIECWKLGGVRDEDVPRAIDGLIIQLSGKVTVEFAANGLVAIGKPALRAIPDLESALEREKANGHSKSFNGPRVERALISAVKRMKALQSLHD